MAEIPHTVLFVGGTGRTGSRLLQELLRRGVNVRAIVRSPGKLPAEAARAPGLTVIEGNVLSLSDEDVHRAVSGCDAVVSCLGHVLSIKGIYGPPRDLVTRTVARLCRAVESLRPSTPVRFVLMSSVSVNRHGRLEARRGPFERALIRLIRGVLPPARDNQRAADFLSREIGAANPFVRWVVVRPDTLREGEITAYTVRESLVNTLFAPGSTNMANAARFMGDLVTDPATWRDWESGMPVIVDIPAG